MRIALLPSPLTAPGLAGPLAAVLQGRGHQPVVCSGDASDVATLLASFVAAAEGADIVVPHSNAGRFGPAVAEAVGATLVCLDSLLPGAEQDAEWEQFLRSREEPDGLLSPWSSWWPREDAMAVFGEYFEALTAHEPRVPLQLMLEVPPAPASWLARRSGYIGFGDTYSEQMAQAERAGWVVRKIPGQHLHLLTEPEAVAEALLDAVSILHKGRRPGHPPMP